MMYKTNKEYRIFLAYEYANDKNFTYILPKNPAHRSLGDTSRVREDSTCPEGGNLGSSNRVDILGVVWGLTIVKDQKVYNYISQAADGNGAIDWNNSNMGGDTWRDALKTGTIYYRHKGTTVVKQISGKENKRTIWSLP
jgi:hypothetical protein